MGFVDTHLHLLPGLDDGPARMEDALAMAEVAIADGISDVIVTPHSNYQFTYVPAQVAALRDQMQALLQQRLRVTSGCELHLSFENVRAATENPRLYTLNGSRYLLVEFPEFFERGALARVLEDFCGLGLTPVLAHPERNPVFQQHPETLQEYLLTGCLCQVTASSFTGRFGQKAQQFSAALLREQQIHLIASDGHSAKQRVPRLSPAFEWIEANASREIAEALCIANPLAILEDRQLPYAPEQKPKKKSLWARLRS